MKPPLRLAKTVRLGLAALVGLDIVLTAAASFRFGFTHDDLMNGYWGLTRPWWLLVADTLRIWRVSPVYRPFAVGLMKGIHTIFGMQLWGWRVVYATLLVASIALTFLVARRLSGSQFVAAMTAILMAFHPESRVLFANMGFVYDILASILTSAFFLCYLWSPTAAHKHVRALLVLGLFTLALGSKEIAVAGALFVLLYELLWSPIRSFREIPGWFKARPLLCAVLGLTLVFALGRVLDPASMARDARYEISLSANNYWVHLRKWARQIFVVTLSLPLFGLVIAPLITYAFIRNRRLSSWCLACFFLGILPVSFIPWRGVEELYVPAMPLAMILAMGWEGFVGLISAAVRRAATRVDALVAGNLIALLSGALFVMAHGSPRARAGDLHFDDSTAEIMPALHALDFLRPSPARKDKIIVDSDPFGGNAWGVTFLFPLYYDDPDLTVWRPDRVPTGMRKDTRIEWRHLEWSTQRWLDVGKDAR